MRLAELATGRYLGVGLTEIEETFEVDTGHSGALWHSASALGVRPDQGAQEAACSGYQQGVSGAPQ